MWLLFRLHYVETELKLSILYSILCNIDGKLHKNVINISHAAIHFGSEHAGWIITHDSKHGRSVQCSLSSAKRSTASLSLAI